jgi:predicted RNA methylase
MFKYIAYFFYIAYNWNPIIACHIIFHEIKGERKYGISTIGVDNLETIESNHINNATIYMPAIYSILEWVFAQVNPKEIHHLVDIGSGKGRVLCVAALLGCKKVTGIDFSEKLCLDALINLSKIKNNIPDVDANVGYQDAYSYKIPKDADCIFLFNPFDESIMQAVVYNILNSYSINKRAIHIIYANPIHKQAFTDAGFEEKRYFKRLRYLEVSILYKH